jgi:hypothetical protein
MSGNTPGPWRWWACKDGSYNSKNDYAQIASWSEHVAQVRIASTTEADLRLMVAAPDLLVALQTLMRVHDEPAGFAGKYGRKLDESIEAQRIKVDSATALARVAIAKATEGQL